MNRSSIFLLIAILAGALLPAAAQDGHSQAAANAPQMTAEKWREDLRTFAERLPAMHKNAFHKMTRAEFDAAVKQLEVKVPTLADHEVVVELMRIVAMVGDGHTGAHIGPFLFGNGIYPVRLYLFDDGLHIRAAAREHAAINGGRVVRIGAVTADEAVKRVAAIAWRDNDMGIKEIGPRLLSSPQVQHALRISNSLERSSITVLKDGREITAELTPTGKMSDLRAATTTFVDSRAAGVPTPLWLKNPDENFWYEYLPESKILFVQFNAVQNKQNETVEAFFDRVMGFAEKNAVEKLVLDLRHNGGGNNTLSVPVTIAAVRSRLNQHGKFFVLIGRFTFSAAQNTVNALEKYTNAIFVGEPTGGAPNHYGDAGRFILPNSKLTIQASTLWWQDLDPRDRRQWKAPDVAADLTAAAYQAGRDPALEAVMNYKPAMTLKEIVADGRRTMDVETFIKRVRQFKADPAHRYVEVGDAVNTAGYFLMGRDLDGAISLFKLNVELHPRSANAHDSLGEAYARKGDKSAALASYKKALEIDPKLPSALEAVRSLSQ